MAAKNTVKIAQRMVANKKKAVTSVQESTDPWEMLFGDDADADPEKAVSKFHKAVQKQSRKSKRPVLKKNVKASAFDRPLARPITNV